MRSTSPVFAPFKHMKPVRDGSARAAKKAASSLAARFDGAVHG
jgi:hypothetical protein